MKHYEQYRNSVAGLGDDCGVVRLAVGVDVDVAVCSLMNYCGPYNQFDVAGLLELDASSVAVHSYSQDCRYVGGVAL